MHLLDLAEGTDTPLTFNDTAWYPLWSHDDAQVIYGDRRSVQYEIYGVAPDGTDAETVAITAGLGNRGDQVLDAFAPVQVPLAAIGTGPFHGSYASWPSFLIHRAAPNGLKLVCGDYGARGGHVKRFRENIAPQRPCFQDIADDQRNRHNS